MSDAPILLFDVTIAPPYLYIYTRRHYISLLCTMCDVGMYILSVCAMRSSRLDLWFFTIVRDFFLPGSHF